VKGIDYTGENQKEVQKLLLEVYLTLINLKELAEEHSKTKIESILQSTPGISSAKRCLKILREQQNFKFVKYYIHQSGLPEYVVKAQNQFFGCMHPHLDVKIRAKYSIPEVECIKFKSNEKCELKPFTFVGVSSTADGKDMKLLTKDNLKENNGITQLNSSDFFVFYPLKKQIVLGMGDNRRNRMTSQSQTDNLYIIKST
jgi:hypothetical protein